MQENIETQDALLSKIVMEDYWILSNISKKNV
jgi:hypothetical protein